MNCESFEKFIPLNENLDDKGLDFLELVKGIIIVQNEARELLALEFGIDNAIKMPFESAMAVIERSDHNFRKQTDEIIFPELILPNLKRSRGN